MHFELLARSGTARRGRLTLKHGVIETPVFMPVGTYGSVKGLTPAQLEDLGAQIILGNTFHLHLQPSSELIAEFGGLHEFIGWNKPILTDSGGFQVFSLAQRRKISEQGVRFRSPRDGSEVELSPESCMKIQRNLNSDIVMCFDECTSYPATHEQAETSMQLSMRWARRCRQAHDALNNSNALFGIVQGGMYPDLRTKSLAGIARDRLRRLRPRWLFGGREQRGDVRRAPDHRRPATGRQAALPDGRGQPRGPGARRRLGCRYVRLRAADAQRPQRALIHQLRGGQAAQRPPQARARPGRPRVLLLLLP